jgi:uncharacterized protein (DUF1501 family)
MKMKTKMTLQTRRKFLRTSMLGAAATWTLPVFLEKTFFALDALAADATTQAITGKDGTILVVLQMAGGNDGLNMVVPYADDAYHVARPRLRLTPRSSRVSVIQTPIVLISDPPKSGKPRRIRIGP